MNEETNHKAGKNVKTMAELYFTLYSKMNDYRAVDVPIVYNFYSVDDDTCFLNFNAKLKLYELYISSTVRNLFLNYQPMRYGDKFDMLINGQYPEMHKIFKKIVEKLIFGKKLQWNDRDELLRQVKECPV